jgi:hypothetical protein
MMTIWDRLLGECKSQAIKGVIIGDLPVVLDNVVLVGRGCVSLPIQQGDVALATDHERGRLASLRISSNGQIHINEHLVTTDHDIADGLRHFLYEAIGVEEIVQECTKCHRIGQHPVVKGNRPRPWICPSCADRIE